MPEVDFSSPAASVGAAYTAPGSRNFRSICYEEIELTWQSHTLQIHNFFKKNSRAHIGRQFVRDSRISKLYFCTANRGYVFEKSRYWWSQNAWSYDLMKEMELQQPHTQRITCKLIIFKHENMWWGLLERASWKLPAWSKNADCRAERVTNRTE